VVVNADLARFTAANTLTLANVDHGSIIDFDNVTTDTAPTANPATDATRSQVVVDDEMPPFVRTAEVDADEMVVRFNEQVTLDGTEALIIESIFGVTVPDAIPLLPGYLSADGLTITIPDTALPATVFDHFAASGNEVFDYAETAYGTGRVRHARLTFADIRDIRGNSWDDWDAAQPEWDGVREVFTGPTFAVADTLGPFEVTTTNTGYQVQDDTTATTQTVVWNFTHPVDRDIATAPDGLEFAGDGAAGIAEVDILAFFDLGTDAVDPEFAAATTSAEFTNSDKTLTLRFRTTVDVTAANQGDASVLVESDNRFRSSVDPTLDLIGSTSISPVPTP